MLPYEVAVGQWCPFARGYLSRLMGQLSDRRASGSALPDRDQRVTCYPGAAQPRR